MSGGMIERLEARRLLAGNVTVSVVDGDLIVSGDGLRNRIQIDAMGLEAGEVRVRPVDESTLVNGDTLAILTGVTGDLRISLGGAADTLSVRDLAVAGDLQIDGGRSSDSILLNRVTVSGALSVRGRFGDDAITVLDSRVGGRSTILGDDGNDRLILDQSTFLQNVTVHGGRGVDAISVDTAKLGKGSSVGAQPGDDEIVTGIDADYAFTSRRLGWQPGFSDYPQGREADWELASGLRTPPVELAWPGKGFLLSGNNHSDDLFMFLKRQLGPEQGLAPNTTYQVRFTITYATNAGTGGFGIGGSAGDSVYLKAGATTQEPTRQVDPDGNWRMTIDKPDQANSGRDVSLIGPITHGLPVDESENPPKYHEATRSHVHTSTVRTDDQGRMWVILGTDSGFEGTTSIYVKSISLRLLPV